jgi:hypothetical protein
MVDDFETVFQGNSLSLGTGAIVTMVAFVIAKLRKNPINGLEVLKLMIHNVVILP